MRVEQEMKKESEEGRKEKKGRTKYENERGLETPIVTVYSLLDKC
jgi:hypothetical protein